MYSAIGEFSHSNTEWSSGDIYTDFGMEYLIIAASLISNDSLGFYDGIQLITQYPFTAFNLSTFDNSIQFNKGASYPLDEAYHFISGHIIFSTLEENRAIGTFNGVARDSNNIENLITIENGEFNVKVRRR